MSVTVRELMQRDVRTVSPILSLPDLEREFIDAQVSGFPVVEGGQLVGVVSRTDIVRQICVERSIAEVTSDFYHDVSGFHEVPVESLKDIADRVGERIDSLRVDDVMVRQVLAISPDEPITAAASRLIEHDIHRLPVTVDGRLVGIVSSMDVVRYVADGRA